MTIRAFVAYPSNPKEIGQCVMRVAERLRTTPGRLTLSPWEQNDVAGRPLIAPIFEGLSSNDLLIADVSVLNFNVTYEIGYAIGLQKRAYLIRHGAIQSDADAIRRVGIFDTLGYETYRDSDELHRKLSYPIDLQPIPFSAILDDKAPLYLLETPTRTETMGRIVARVKKAGLRYRSFTPSEHVRLAAIEAISDVAASHGALIPLQPSYMQDSAIHNVRAAFVAGLAHGMRKPTLLLQIGGDPVPLDVRDFVVSCDDPKDIDEHVENLAKEILESLQSGETRNISDPGFLAALTVGDPMAENEFQTLGSYFIETDQYLRTLRGEVNLVVGRKGTGKTALFSQVRDRLRSDKQRIVVDLKPEGYQLQKLKEEVYRYLSQGAREHLLVAFWEYLLLLEVCYKILEKDKERHLRDHRLTEPYRSLMAAYHRESGTSTGDFSERLHELSDRIAAKYISTHGRKSDVHLSADAVTELIHRHDLLELRQKISDYLKFKHGAWVLFDNLDRGWSPLGLSSDDILVVRTLIDAGRKIQRSMQKDGHDFHCIIFLRNDVYQLLMRETADFGKEMRTSIDWTDPDLLRELVFNRLQTNTCVPKDVSFDRVWAEIAVPLIDGTGSFQYLVERSLMRPRNLLKLIIHCKGSAVNLAHQRISEEDIRKGVRGYSTDLLIEMDQELAQIDASASGFVYNFVNEQAECSREDLEVLLEIGKVPADRYAEVISFLLYYGFLGIRIGREEPKYIYDMNYDMRMMETHILKYDGGVGYVVNPAFWPALSVKAN